MIYILTFLLALIITLWVTPQLRKIAYRIDYIEKPKPGSRKIHKEPKPYLAAVGIYGVFWIVYFIVAKGHASSKIWGIFSASTVVFVIGMVDDWFKIKGKDLKALPKMIVQVAACVMAFYSGVRFIGVTNPMNGGYLLFPDWLQFILTILWIFGIMTVINFTDGMDGLAGGIACISAFTMFVVALGKNANTMAIMAICLVAVCLGYLRYNKFPAKILMGDAGATFIGFILAIISLEGAFKHATIISILVPVLTFGLPIFDNLYVVYKRIRNGKPIYVGDSTQVHYRLLKEGLSQIQVVKYLYLVCACLNLGAIIIYMLHI